MKYAIVSFRVTGLTKGDSIEWYVLSKERLIEITNELHIARYEV